MPLVLKTGLEFAPGTTDECKKLVGRLFQPGDILGAYRIARETFKTNDLVLIASEQDPSGFDAEPRNEYVRRASGPGGVPLLMRRLAADSAQTVMMLPADADAVWLVIARGSQAVPVMCVIFATPYEIEVASAN